MEQLFSTVAQVVFTIVGLFFVSLTFDANTRDFWFGQETNRRYVYINLLVMVFPGFLALGRLIAFPGEISWVFPGCSMLFFCLFLWVYRLVGKLKKESNFLAIVDIDRILDIRRSVFSVLIVSFFCTLGIVNYFAKNQDSAKMFDYFLGFFLLSLIFTSIINISVFFRTPAKTQTQLIPDSNNAANLMAGGPIQNSNIFDKRKGDVGIFYLGILLTGLIAFLVGLICRRD